MVECATGKAREPLRVCSARRGEPLRLKSWCRAVANEVSRVEKPQYQPIHLSSVFNCRRQSARQARIWEAARQVA